MVSASKLFNEAVRSKNCKDLTHNGSCAGDAIGNFYYFLRSNARYFGPITMLPLLLKIRKWNKSLLLETFKYYVECTVYGTIHGWGIKVFMCLFYHLIGEFRPLTFIFVPSLIITSVMMFASRRVQQLYYMTVYQSLIETYLIRRKNFVTKAIANSRLFQTSIFMCCSAIILHAKHNGVYRGFWLLTPNTTNTTTVTTKTAIANTTETAQIPDIKQLCGIKYVLIDIRNYVAIGFTLDTIKMLLSKVSRSTSIASASTTGAWTIRLTKLRNFRFNSTALMGCYVGIYRLVEYYGKHWLPQQQKELHEWLAGFLAGASFIFMPKLTLLTYAIAQTIGILWRYYELRSIEDYDESASRFPLIQKHIHKLQQHLKRIPYGTLIYTVGLSYIIHVYALRPSYIGSLAETVLNAVTDNYAIKISKNIAASERLMKAATTMQA